MPGGRTTVGFFFDLSASSGLGHFARAKALSRALAAADPSFVTKLVPLTLPQQAPADFRRLCENLPTDSRVYEGASWMDTCDDYEVLFIDSYRTDVQSLAWMDNGNLRQEKKLVLICDSVWPGLRERPERYRRLTLTLDATYALGSQPKAQHHLFGADAVFLNLDSLQANSSSQGTNPSFPPLISLGVSAAARAALPDIVSNFEQRWPSPGVLHPGARHGVVRLESSSKLFTDDLHVGEALRRAPELLIAAGQMLWEAALLRDSFWVVALTPVHVEVLARLVQNRVCEQIEATTVGQLQLRHLQVPESTRRRLLDQPHRARQIGRMLTSTTLSS